MLKLSKSKEKWHAQLTPEQYKITREKGTERAFTGVYVDSFVEGIYHCVCCGQALFDSKDKYDAKCGWPSFSRPIDLTAVVITQSFFSGLLREEVACQRCDAHLGHVFADGPPPTGLRYCMNSIALKLRRKIPFSAK